MAYHQILSLRSGFALLILLSLLFIFFGYQRCIKPALKINESKLPKKSISAHCVCIDNSTNIPYDFCFESIIRNQPVHGRSFLCGWLPILKELHLLDDQQWSNSHDMVSISKPVFVTGISQPFFDSVLVLIDSIQRHFPHKPRIIVYDLDLDPSSADLLSQLCGVEYRRFNYTKYPDWVARLFEFRWKPLIIAETLNEFASVWYVDASIKFNSGNLSSVYSSFNCSIPSAPTTAQDFEAQFKKPSCQSPYLLHSYSGHGIFSATHPDLYQFFPTDLDKLKDAKCSMYDAGFAFVIRSRDSQQLLKWFVLCALERFCMGPIGALGSMTCSFNAVDRYGKYAKCHRFDQSVINLLLANRYGYDSKYWSGGLPGTVYAVERRQKLLSNESEMLLQYC